MCLIMYSLATDKARSMYYAASTAHTTRQVRYVLRGKYDAYYAASTMRTTRQVQCVLSGISIAEKPASLICPPVETGCIIKIWSKTLRFNSVSNGCRALAKCCLLPSAEASGNKIRQDSEIN
jgi:hypothetical protein